VPSEFDLARSFVEATKTSKIILTPAGIKEEEAIPLISLIQ